MPNVFTVSRKAYTERQLRTRRAVLAVRKAWQQVDKKAIRPSWVTGVGQSVRQTVTEAQFAAAQAADGAVTAVLHAQGITDHPVGRVNPVAFSGAASDGRDLASLLEIAPRRALQGIKAGQTADEALSDAGKWLEMVVGTQVSDAGQAARQAAITANKHIDGFYRILVPPSCARCAVLAGKWFQWHADWERHPRCDCDQIAANDNTLDDHPRLWTPEAYFNSLTKTEQDHIFTQTGAQAIRDGADIGQVVNARRGMYTAGGKVLTTEGKKSRNGGVRLMPEQIYAEAHGNRDEAIRLMKLFGYLR